MTTSKVLIGAVVSCFLSWDAWLLALLGGVRGWWGMPDPQDYVARRFALATFAWTFFVSLMVAMEFIRLWRVGKK